jgi:hypothetical protein
MNPKRFFFVMVAVFMLSIGGGGAMLIYANTLLEKRSSDVKSLRLESIELEEQQKAYMAAKANVEKYSYLKEIINAALPQEKDQARSVREIFILAEQVGIKIKSIQFPSSSLGTITAKPVATASGETPAPTPKAATPVVTQAKAVDGLKGVYSLEAVVTPYSDGKVYRVSYDQLIEFLKKLESNRRAMQVSSIQLTPLGQTQSDSISFTVTLNIFIKP